MNKITLEQYKEITKKLERQYNSAELYPFEKCVSSSQLILLDKDEERFTKQYVIGEEIYSVPLLIGTIFSEMYAGNTKALDLLKEAKVCEPYIYERLEKAIKQIPKATKTEEEIRVQFDNWTIRVTLDGFFPKENTVIENKTGKTIWTQEAVESDKQVSLQSWAVWKTTGKIPTIFLNWVDFNKNSSKHIQSFKVKKTVIELKKFERDFIQTNLNKLF